MLQIELVWNRPVNWDEFFHLSEAHAFARGELRELLQVFYARGFFWLAWLKIDAVDQIRVARVFMLACEIVTCCAIYATARRFANKTAALLATLAYISAGYVLQHGMSFRADPMAAATLMAALWILLRGRLHIANIITAAFLIGLGFAVTIKIVLYAPAFLAVAWVRWHETADRRDLLRKTAILIFFSIAFAALFTLASWFTLPSAPPPAAREASKSLSSSGTMMFDLGLFPRWPYLLMAMFTAPVLTLAALRAAAVLARSATAPGRNLRIAAWLMLATIGCVSFYANSFPYFYAFILPPVAVVAAIGMEALAKSVSVKFLIAAMLIQAMASSVSTPRSVLPAQKQMLAAVHQIFPQPVAYFDFPGMVPEFSKANFFMTVWGVRKYMAGLEPSLAEAARMQVVPLLIVNQEPLERNQTTPDGAWELKPEDRALLKDGFIPHWGPLWVAGHAFKPRTDQASFTIYAPGTYTLEGGAARIDGAVVAAGQTVQLARGNHLFVRLQNGSVVLRWGDHLARPSMLEPVGPVLKDF
ncbi:hypothetical protein GGQ88_002532 [Novosphingobium hassiacum]|uniref:Glycosyltransferase RgtA/B/C/D-like domain-containing protein n=1 Tax=Novosphingobium hassiacum TaxID=173676 RepID=A0A7W6EWQ8_9SPHN|nr:glycosyltransferase family 39 protein [Novosphingobium hassiacum]MBB3861260.1 hypothetical protein [Novosphingobium hassiacum]